MTVAYARILIADVIDDDSLWLRLETALAELTTGVKTREQFHIELNSIVDAANARRIQAAQDQRKLDRAEVSA